MEDGTDGRGGKDVKEATVERREEKCFNIKEAAEILDCKKSTVYQLLADGWLKRPVGWGLKGGFARVSEKSLFQLLFYNYVSSLKKKTSDELNRRRKNFGRFFSKNSDWNRFSSNERTAGTGEDSAATRPNDPSPYPLPQGEGKQQRLHHDFVEKHQFSFGWRARQLAKDDPSLQDDLVQEMSLAVLEYDKPANFEYLFELAGNRAIDYLRYEEARGRMSLSQARQQTDVFAEKMASLMALIDQLVARGLPPTWIEEVLGERLEVA